MSTYQIIYNPHAGNDNGARESKKLLNILSGNTLCFHDMTEIIDFNDEISGYDSNDIILISGGDGTLNRFINSIDVDKIVQDIMFFSCGSGNDFFRDLEISKESKPISIKKYLYDLPVVTVNGQKYKFINGIGYGIDGYCCEEGDRLRKKSKKRINYTSIALKGLLYAYKPTKATITIDGVTKEYNKVWLAPTMKGRYFGGGMMPTPNQDRMDKDKYVTCAVMYGPNKIKALMTFPLVFKGQIEEKHPELVESKKGHSIHVKFDKPTALQVDGETQLNVLEYFVES